MLKRPIRFVIGLYNQAGMLATLSGCSIAAIFAAVSGYVARQTIWIARYGAIAWLGVGVIAACIGMGLAIGVAHLRYKMAAASAINKWKERVESINPLDIEFSRKRINVSDLVSPITNGVSDKRFIDCELVGPANIFFGNDLSINNCGFHNCDIVPIRIDAIILNGIRFERTDLYRTNFVRCTIYVIPPFLTHFQKMGASFVGLTGVAEVDHRPFSFEPTEKTRPYKSEI